jgi:hypothetical protein
MDPVDIGPVTTTPVYDNPGAWVLGTQAAGDAATVLAEPQDTQEVCSQGPRYRVNGTACSFQKARVDVMADQMDRVTALQQIIRQSSIRLRLASLLVEASRNQEPGAWGTRSRHATIVSVDGLCFAARARWIVGR